MVCFHHILPPRYCSGHHHLATAVSFLRAPLTLVRSQMGARWPPLALRPNLVLPQTKSLEFLLFPIFGVQHPPEKIHQIDDVQRHSGWADARGRVWVGARGRAQTDARAECGPVHGRASGPSSSSMTTEAALASELWDRCHDGHGGRGEILWLVASFFGPTGGGRWLWCGEDEGSGLVWLGVEETEETEKTRAGRFGSFSVAKRFSILEEYSLLWNLSAPYCFNQTQRKVERSHSVPLNSWTKLENWMRNLGIG
jgi:hypothetical protein